MLSLRILKGKGKGGSEMLLLYLLVLNLSRWTLIRRQFVCCLQVYQQMYLFTIELTSNCKQLGFMATLNWRKCEHMVEGWLRSEFARRWSLVWIMAVIGSSQLCVSLSLFCDRDGDYGLMDSFHPNPIEMSTELIRKAPRIGPSPA